MAKICPILSSGECIVEQCAWYYLKGKRCSVVELAGCFDDVCTNGIMIMQS
jgi:hypothetical protein